MSEKSLPPICVRLPEDLDVAIRTRGAAEGLSPSEMLRSIITQWAYGSTPSVDEGYRQARSIAVRLAHEAIARAFDQLPEGYEEALALSPRKG
jgi:hypothetical protein